MNGIWLQVSYVVLERWFGKQSESVDIWGLIYPGKCRSGDSRYLCKLCWRQYSNIRARRSGRHAWFFDLTRTVCKREIRKRHAVGHRSTRDPPCPDGWWVYAPAQWGDKSRPRSWHSPPHVAQPLGLAAEPSVLQSGLSKMCSWH